MVGYSTVESPLEREKRDAKQKQKLLQLWFTVFGPLGWWKLAKMIVKRVADIQI